MMEIILVILILWTIISIWIIYNLYRKNILLEKIDELNSEWIGVIENEITDTYIKMKQIDSMGIFEKDDDVGESFTSLLLLTQKCAKKISEYDEELKKIQNTIQK